MDSNLRSLTTAGKWAVWGLALGMVLGLVGQALDLSAVRMLSGYLAPVGSIWLRALQMAVLPLIVTQLLVALVRPGKSAPLGSLAGRTFALSMGYMLGFGALVVVVAPPILNLFSLPPNVGAAFTLETIPQAALDAAESGSQFGGSSLVGLIPANPFAAAAQGQILQLVVFVILFGAAASRLPDDQRTPLAHLFRSLADAVMTLVRWVLWGMPVGVFCLALNLTLGLGFEVLSLFAIYTGVICGIFLLFIGVLYPLSVLGGRVSLRTFAEALMPAQIVAAGTQSSMASLPALIEGAKRRLALPESGSGFVLPFCASTFRFNTPVSEGFNLLFLAYVFGVPLTLGQITVYLLAMVVMSFSVAGVPRGGVAFPHLPLQVALGIPVEGIVFIEMAKTVPDVFSTLYNVTANMSVATIVSAWTRRLGRLVAGTADPAVRLLDGDTVPVPAAVPEAGAPGD